MGDAVTRAPRDLGFVRRVLKRLLAITLVLEFIVNVYALPLGYELVGILVVFVFVGMQTVAQHDESLDPRVRTFIDGVLVIVGLVYLIHFAVRVFADLDGFLTRENAEDFLVGPVLTIALIPFLYGVGWASRRDQENLRKRWRSASNFPA